MVDPTPSDYHLTYLRERWERDRSSRIFLQLAEEYRRRGLHGEALEVLETGLGFHPGYLAAQVALGRCRLEAGQPAAAIKVLDRVLTQDPTQAVATRLLAESWLQLGDDDRAQAAIDRCRLIGIPPSELVGLEQRMLAARRAARERSAEPPEPPSPRQVEAPEPLAELEDAPLPWQDETGSRAFEAGPTAAEPISVPTVPPAAAVAAGYPAASAFAPLPAPEPAIALRPSHSPANAAATSAIPSGDDPSAVFHLPLSPARAMVLPLRPGDDRRLAGPRRSEPFGSLARPAPPTASAEIFRIVPADGSNGPAAPSVAAAALVATAAPAAIPAPEPHQLATTPPFLESASPPASEPLARVVPSNLTPASTPAAAPLTPRWWDRPTEGVVPVTLPPVLPDPIPTASPAGSLVPAPVPARALARPPQVPEPAGSIEAPVAAPRSPLADTAGVELQPSGFIATPELRPSDPGTATLGELYLRQGYVREAEEIFKQVLARDADNEAALSGLETIGRRRAQKLTAAELLAGKEGPDETPVLGLTARKIQVLTRYLRTLRRGAGTDVPGTAQ